MQKWYTNGIYIAFAATGVCLLGDFVAYRLKPMPAFYLLAIILSTAFIILAFVSAIQFAQSRNLRAIDALPNHPYISISSNNKVELIEIIASNQLWPLPNISIRKRVMANLSLQKLFRYALVNAKKEAFEKLRWRLSESFITQFKSITKSAIEPISKRADKVIKDSISEKSIAIISNKSPDLEATMELLENTSNMKISRFKQNVAAQVRETAENSLKGMETRLVENILAKFSEATPPMEGLDDSVFSDDVKFWHSYRNRTVVVVEQKPQQRTVSFNDEFLRRDKGRESSREREKGEQFYLAFPYMVFIIEFLDDELLDVYLYYRNSPIKSLNDPLLRSNLPNVSSTNCICLDLNVNLVESTLIEKVHQVISDFWQSQFSKDYMGNHYIPMQDSDERLKNISQWAKESKSNPNFVLTVRWKNSNELLGDVVRRLLSKTFYDRTTEMETIVKRSIGNTTDDLVDNIKKMSDCLSTENTSADKLAVSQLSEHLLKLSQVFAKEVNACIEKTLTEQAEDNQQQLFGELMKGEAESFRVNFDLACEETSITVSTSPSSLLSRIKKGEVE